MIYRNTPIYSGVFKVWTVALAFTLFPLTLSADETATATSADDDSIVEIESASKTQTLVADPEAPVEVDPERIKKVKETKKPVDKQVKPKAEQLEPFMMMEKSFAPGVRDTVFWPVMINSLQFNIPVIVAHGARQGPVMCMTAAVHGDELNGIEIARRVIYGLDPEKLAGTVVAVPIVNMEGFMKQQRYMADRRDMNRFFPGDPNGVTPARFAYALMEMVIQHCDALIDLHTGSFYRTNLPQLRADLKDEKVARMVTRFGGMTVLQSAGKPGMLRNAAVAMGIPAVTMEVGGPLSLELEAVEFGVKAINTFLGELGMTKRLSFWKAPQPVFYESQWVMSNHSGILLASVKLGDKVKDGEVLAEIINPVTNAKEKVKAPYAGTVLGMAVNQFVSPGFVIFRIGKETTESELRDEAIKDETEAARATTSKALDKMIDNEERPAGTNW